MRLSGFFLAAAMMLSAVTAASASEWDGSVVSLGEDSWRTIAVAHEAEPDGPPGESEAVRGGRLRDADRWSTVLIPDSVEGPRQLVFACYRARVEVWLDDKIVYRFADEAAEGRRSIHSVQLDEPGGHLVSVRLPSFGAGPSFDTPIILSRPESTPSALGRLTSDPLREDLGPSTAGAILLVVGLVSIVVSLVRWRQRERALLSFGVFTLVYGARLVIDTSVAPLAGMPQATRGFLISGLTYLINIPATLFALQVIGRGWKSSILWMARAAGLFFFVGVLSDVVAGNPFTADRVNNVLVIANGIILIVNLARWKALRSADGIILTSGLALFGLLALLENVRALFDVFDWSEGVEWIGFMVLMAALGWVALRRFLRGEAELIEIGKELEMARSIQKSILPSASPAADRLKIHARYIPMTAVAGDFYDYYNMPDGRIGVLVADVSGHGVPAAMVASMVKVAASTHATESSDPAELMSMLNRTLCHHLGREFVTVSWMVFDPASMTVRVCNAGHPPPLRLTGGSVRPLGAFGILVGKFRDAKYKAATIELAEGDRILCFTDGITEAKNANEEEFGYARLEASLSSNRNLDLEGMLDNLVGEVKWWAGKRQQGDDLTVVGIDVGGGVKVG